MARWLLAAILGGSVLLGAGAFGLREIGVNANKTFETLNRALEQNPAPKGKISSREAVAWIARYQPDTTHVGCRNGRRGWDYSCSFVKGGRRLKIGVVAGAVQPTETSLPVPLHRRLPRRAG
jgi:hypothetical protein